MTTAADLIARTRRHLFTGQREELNKLDGDVMANSTELAFTFPTAAISAGSTVEVDTEVFYILSADSSGVATVIPAFNGTASAAHTAGAIATLNPKFPAFDILNALNDDLADLNALGLYQTNTIDITYRPPFLGYDLTGSDSTGIYDILDIQYEPIGPSRYWPRLTNFQLLRAQDTSRFPSGNVLQLTQVPQPGRTIRVTYSMPFFPLASVSDDVANTGLPVTAYDLPPLGAALELTAGLEIKRNFTDNQGMTRHATEVPAGANLNSSRGLMQRRMQRLNDEFARQSSDYPKMSLRV